MDIVIAVLLFTVLAVCSRERLDLGAVTLRGAGGNLFPGAPRDGLCAHELRRRQRMGWVDVSAVRIDRSRR
jgi:hypothetical protein